jgi:hypothetical protein
VEPLEASRFRKRWGKSSEDPGKSGKSMRLSMGKASRNGDEPGKFL